MPDTIITPADMDALATSLGYPHSSYDLLLVADGSGSIAQWPCGWCCFAWYSGSDEVRQHSGCASYGTSNYAELEPFVQAMWWSHPSGPHRVLCVSDSELTVKQGKGEYTVHPRNGNSALWAAIRWFAQFGHTFTWHHVRRNSNPVNTECDRVAGICRKLLVC